MRDPRPAAPSAFDRGYPLLAWLRSQGLGEVPMLERTVRRAAAFRARHVEPAALSIERRMMRDPGHVPGEVLHAASREGWFTTMVPRAMGGQGLPFGVTLMALEEISAGCLGLANLLGVHGLALCMAASSGDVARSAPMFRKLAESERAGEPTLLSTALTEPSAGTDMEDIELLRKGRLVSEARPIPGGYLLNGRKVFISNGSLAATHVTVMPTDRRRPAETLSTFLVDRGTPGLSVGRIEKKMGQKVCPAAELIFEDCFVPEDKRLRGAPVAGRGLDLTLGATRVGVGVFGTGVARGAYERALRWARSKRIGGRPAIEEQWVRMRLAEMRRNVMIGRSAYLEGMLANDLFGLSAVIQTGWMDRAARLVPGAAMARVLASDRVTEGMARRIVELPEERVGLSSALGAHAKITGSDLGVRNCELAIEIAGADGLRHDVGIEKLLRDAKLLQIYEGTNQLNRIEVYQRLVATEVTHA